MIWQLFLRAGHFDDFLKINQINQIFWLKSDFIDLNKKNWFFENTSYFLVKCEKLYGKNVLCLQILISLLCFIFITSFYTVLLKMGQCRCIFSGCQLDILLPSLDQVLWNPLGEFMKKIQFQGFISFWLNKSLI